MIKVIATCSLVSLSFTGHGTAFAQQTFAIPDDIVDTAFASIMGSGALTGGQFHEAVKNPSAKGSVLLNFNKGVSAYALYNVSDATRAMPIDSFAPTRILFPDLAERGFIVGGTWTSTRYNANKDRKNQHGAFSELAVQRHTIRDAADAEHGFDMLTSQLGYRFVHERHPTNAMRFIAGLSVMYYGPLNSASKSAFARAFADREMPTAYIGGAGKVAFQVNDFTVVEINCRYLRAQGRPAGEIPGAHCVFGPAVSGTLMKVQ